MYPVKYVHWRGYDMCPNMTKWGSCGKIDFAVNWFWVVGKNMSQGQNFSVLIYILSKSSYQTQSWQTHFVNENVEERSVMEHFLLD